MRDPISPALAFPMAGLFSSLGCCVALAFPGSGLFAPGILFGLALIYGFEMSVTTLSWAQRIGIVLWVFVGYIAAIFASLLFVRFHGNATQIPELVMAGSLVGTVGGLIVATMLAIAIPQLPAFRTVVVITLVSLVLTAVSSTSSVYLSDHTSAPLLVRGVVIFGLWHTGVASTVPLLIGPKLKAARAWRNFEESNR